MDLNIDNNKLIPEQKLAEMVLGEYDVVPSNIRLIQGGSIKTVWKVTTDKGALCLKRLKQTYDKASFSVNAQVYIRSSGGNVPGIIPNIKGELISACNDQLFVLYEWVDGKDLDFGNSFDLKNALKGLARFHTFSKGYIPPGDSRISTKLGKWPEQYTSMLGRLASWSKVAAADIAQTNYAAYLRHTTAIAGIGASALEEIEASDYRSLTEAGSKAIVLCHQDFGRGNALMTDRGVYILDLDGVTFDLAARDLRKIIGKISESRNRWQAETINEIVGCYEEVRPLGQKEKKLLYIDMLFPHWYHALVKNLFQAGKPVKASEIEKTAELELSKVPILKTLLRGSELI